MTDTQPQPPLSVEELDILALDCDRDSAAKHMSVMVNIATQRDLIAMTRRAIEAKRMHGEAFRIGVEHQNAALAAEARITELEAEIARLTAPLEGSETSEEQRGRWRHYTSGLGKDDPVSLLMRDLDHATAAARTAAEGMRERCVETLNKMFRADNTDNDILEEVRALPLTPTETESDD